MQAGKVLYMEGVWQVLSMIQEESNMKRTGNQLGVSWENTKQTPLPTIAQIKILELRSSGSCYGCEVPLSSN